MPTVTSRSRMPGDRPVGCHGGPGDISSGSGWLQAGQTVGAITIKPPSTSDLLSLYRRVFRPWPPENFSCGHGDEKGSSRQLLPGQNRLIWFWAIKMRSVLQGYSNPIRTLRMVRVTGFEPTASWSRTKRATSCATPGSSPLRQTSGKPQQQPYYSGFPPICQVDLANFSAKS